MADESKTVAKKEERYQIVIELARKNSLVTRSMIEKALHVSTSTAVLVLKKMLQLGLLKIWRRQECKLFVSLLIIKS